MPSVSQDQVENIDGKDIPNTAHSIQVRSELAEEIISAGASFTDKWALLIFTLFVLSLFLLAWLIYYPDTVYAPITLTSEGAPKELVPHQSGRIIRLFVTNKDSIRKGQPIMWIESTARHQDVLMLGRLLDSIILALQEDRVKDVAALSQINMVKLGDIQPAYQQFIVARQGFEDYYINGYYAKKRSIILKDIQSLNETRRQIEGQRYLTLQDVTLSERLFAMNETLYVQKVISQSEYLAEKSKLLNKKQLVPNEDNTLLMLETDIRNKEQLLRELDHNSIQQKDVFEQSITALKAAVDSWINNYVILAPINGEVSFTAPLQENQYIQQGKIFGFLTPTDSNYYVQANLPQYNFGKLSTGEKVQVRFDAYPYQDMGYVAGSLASISSVPSENGFLAMIRLDSGLITTHKLRLSYRSGLKGQAVIVTRKTRLLLKLFRRGTTFLMPE